MKKFYKHAGGDIWSVDTLRDSRYSAGIFDGIEVRSRNAMKFLTVLTYHYELLVCKNFHVVEPDDGVAVMLRGLLYGSGRGQYTTHVLPPMNMNDVAKAVNALNCDVGDNVVVSVRDYYCAIKFPMAFKEVRVHKGLFNPANSEAFVVCLSYNRNAANLPAGDHTFHIEAVRKLSGIISEGKGSKVKAYSSHTIAQVIRAYLVFVIKMRNHNEVQLYDAARYLGRVLKNGNYRDIVLRRDESNQIFPGVSFSRERLYISEDYFVASNAALSRMVLYSSDPKLIARFLIERGEKKNLGHDIEHHEVLDKKSIERYWMLSPAYRPLWLLCDTHYEVGHGIDIYARNAVRERLDIWRIHDATLDSVYRRMAEFANNTLYNVDGLRKVLNGNAENFGLLKDGGWLIKPNELVAQYDFGYVNGKFEKLIYTGKSIHNILNKGVVLVGDSTKLMQDTRLYNASKNINIDDIMCPQVKLITGVPGCGKTSYILKQIRKNDAIVTTTRENRDDIKARLNDDKFLDRVRTMHSVIMHGTDFNVDKLYVDEALVAS